MVTDTGETNKAQRFGRYLLLERIGSGGMAEVFRAVAQGLEGFQRTFVLKRIRADHTTQSDFLDMFVNEARISALLDHENIVQVYDFGEVEGCYFLTMEYLRGRDLSTVLRKLYSNQESLDPAIVAYVGCKVARGLAYAHGLHVGGEPMAIVHRDVSPSNIMLLRSGGVKLLDFGIAKTHARYNVGETTETGVCKGKLPYLSPEHVDGQTLDGRSDVFGLGVVLWEALTGRRLFLGRTDFETMQNVLSRPIPPPSMLRPEVPAALDAVVAHALERDRERRCPSARHLADELEAVIQDLRYRSDAIPELLTRLFGREENSVQITPPHLPAVDINALGTIASRSTRRERGKGLRGWFGGGRRRASVAAKRKSRWPWPSSRQLAVIAGAALLGAAAFSLGSMWQRPAQSASRDRGEKNPVVLAGPGPQR
jgi:serine/threonine protein kinase